MDKSEFERIKAEEKEHLRQLRALKDQHRDAQRKASILGALRGMGTPEQDATHDEFTGKLAQDAAMTEARFEIASEDAERAAQAERDAEVTRQSEAEALIAQMKAELGGGAERTPSPRAETPSRQDASRQDASRQDASRQDASRPTTARSPSSPTGTTSAKTIGRTPPEPEAPESAEPERGAKSIGRGRTRD